ncbi:MAG: T9SS type A sorting domain-containing protein [Saprospiraceae bacterium]
MKSFVLLIISLIGFFTLTAQDTAMDWTRTACGTTEEHHLFSELDSGYVIIIEFVMMNCGSCVNATNGLKNILADYNQSHPDKVRMYSVGFNNTTLCPQLVDWMNSHGYKHNIFEKGAAETSYYGGMGMPTIVILGGGLMHKVYHNNFGYAPSDDPVIEAAIDLAISESTISSSENITDGISLKVFPNPFSDELTLDLSGLHATHLAFMDLTGKLVSHHPLAYPGNEGLVTISTKSLHAGVWVLSIYDGERQIAKQKVFKK